MALRLLWRLLRRVAVAVRSTQSKHQQQAINRLKQTLERERSEAEHNIREALSLAEAAEGAHGKQLVYIEVLEDRLGQVEDEVSAAHRAGIEVGVQTLCPRLGWDAATLSSASCFASSPENPFSPPELVGPRPYATRCFVRLGNVCAAVLTLPALTLPAVRVEGNNATTCFALAAGLGDQTTREGRLPHDRDAPRGRWLARRPRAFHRPGRLRGRRAAC